MTRYLITGVNGCSGHALALQLAKTPGAVVLGTGRRALARVPLAAYQACDLTERDAVCDLVAQCRPDVVFHLAGLNGMDAADEIWRANVAAFEHLRSALRMHASARPVRLIVAGSAAELGAAGAAQLPVTEQAPCQPETAYGRSKREITRQALAEPRGTSLDIIVARPFNLVGPRLDPRLALGNFARQLSLAARGQCDTIHCGNLDARRDYLDVRDAATAYIALAARGQPGQLYNVCSGRSHRIGDLLSRMIELAGVRVRIASTPSAVCDVRDIFGDCGKLVRNTGWQPTISIDASLADLLAEADASRAAKAA